MDDRWFGLGDRGRYTASRLFQYCETDDELTDCFSCSQSQQGLKNEFHDYLLSHLGRWHAFRCLCIRSTSNSSQAFTCYSLPFYRSGAHFHALMTQSIRMARSEPIHILDSVFVGILNSCGSKESGSTNIPQLFDHLGNLVGCARHFVRMGDLKRKHWYILFATRPTGKLNRNINARRITMC